METFKEISSLFALIDIFLILFELHILLKKLFHVSSFKGKIRSFIVSFLADCCAFTFIYDLVESKSVFLQYLFYFFLFILLMFYPCRRFIKKNEVKTDLVKSEQIIAQVAEKTDIEFSDEIYIKALKVFSMYPKVSTTKLQRKLKLNYDSAVKIMDVLEEKGFIKDSDSSSLKTLVYSPSELKQFNFIVTPNSETEKHEEKKDALQFAKEIYYKENSENLEKLSDEYCSKQAEYINWFYNEIKGFSVSLVKSDKSFEENKIKYIIALNSGTTTANIKYCKKELAEYLNVNVNDLKIHFSNPETRTVITIPFPNSIINIYKNVVSQEKE